MQTRRLVGKLLLRDQAGRVAATFKGVRMSAKLTGDIARRYKMLSNAELATLARKGTLEARQEMVLACLRLAYSLAARVGPFCVPLEDRMQAAALGLTRATETFDPDNGGVFSSWATWEIKNQLHLLERAYRRNHAPQRPYHEPPDEMSDPTTKIEVLARLSRLDGRRLRVVQLALEGRNGEEVAHETGIRRQAANIHIKKATAHIMRLCGGVV